MLVAGAVAATGACGPSGRPGGGDDDDDGGGPGKDSGPDDLGQPDAQTTGSCEKMDILFVIDDSISMAQEQDNLTANFPGFIQVLDDYRTSADRPLDWRVGVITTGRTYKRFLRTGGQDHANGMVTGDDGALRRGCGLTQPWISRGDSGAATTFSCVAKVGIGGPTDEMPLGTTVQALGDRISDGKNAGFLRPDALLAIVVLSDEDDCSTTGATFTTDANVPPAPNAACIPGRPVELATLDSTLAFLDGVKGDPGRWALAVIAGPGPNTCMSSFGDAIPATRLLDLVGRKAPRASFSSICEGNLSKSLSEALATFDAACQTFPPVE